MIFVPGEVLKGVARGRRFAADERARFTGMLPGKFDPNPPDKDRFPVTIGEGCPPSAFNNTDDWNENPESLPIAGNELNSY